MAKTLEEAPCSRAMDNLPPLNQSVKPYYKDGQGSKSIGEPEWRPHPKNALSVPNRLNNSVRGGNGLDWFSRIRCAPQEDYTHPRSSLTKEKEVFHHLQSTDDKASQSTLHETEGNPTRNFSHDPIEHDTSDDFNQNDMRRPMEISLRMSLGAKRKECLIRVLFLDVTTKVTQKMAELCTEYPFLKVIARSGNGVPAASPGDKSYEVPEYSHEFHKHGSTRPVISFGGSLHYIPDTFVPLQDLPLKPRILFEEKEKIKLKQQEIEEVEDLDNWRPSDPLIPTLQTEIVK
ncbi:Spermatogenesis-associated serine-rich protein 1 [Acropora cervicornis]|uniref:Spermatogenesis-associated serine-rich protein 1 n=1 Tax=Acropora cervicornis TaxID=6130 RepID=A0AAD9Q9S6_ACRCE|nr:Spermatogenesis-associated serine-rich protein 1 [Acropora cervicornis]